MGIVPQYGLPVYHIAQLLSMNNFHNSEARASFFLRLFCRKSPLSPIEIPDSTLRVCTFSPLSRKLTLRKEAPHEPDSNRQIYRRVQKSPRPDPEAAGRQTRHQRQNRIQMGTGSFPKLKIPHQTHADFCSTDTAGGLDNKKRRYAPRGGIAYRLFLWGFPKGDCPHWHTTLLAKCSVLYALSALP